MNYRIQKNVTLSPEQIQTAVDLVNKGLKPTAISRELKLSLSKLRINLRLLGLGPVEKEKDPYDFKDRNGNFNVDRFGKLYRW